MKELFHKIFVDDYQLKLASLLVAALAWIAVSLKLTGEGDVVAELHITPPQGCVIMYDGNEGRRILGNGTLEFTLNLVGPKSVLDSLRDLKGERAGTCDLSGLEAPPPGAADSIPLELKPEFFEGLKGVTITGYTGPRILLDTVVSRENIPVKVQVVGESEMDSGYRLNGEPLIVPTKITVKGPSSVLTGSDIVALTTINVALLTRDYTKNFSTVEIGGVPIDLKDTDTISVTVYVEAEPLEQEFKNVKLYVMSPPGFALDSVVFDARLLTVKVKGPPEKILKVIRGDLDLILYVDVSPLVGPGNVEPGNVVLPIKVLSPSEVVLVEPNSATGKVTVAPTNR